MLKPYRELFSIPGTLAFSAAGFLARITMSTVGLGIVLLLSAVHGRYGLAGLVSGTYTLVAALISPQVGRLSDRYGQSRLLLPAACVFTVGLLSLVVCAVTGAPDWTLFATAAVTGCGMPSVGSLIRARWAKLYSGTSRLHTAYSLESVLDELVFVTGPILVTALTTQVHRMAGLLAVWALAVTGMLWLSAQRATQPVPHGPEHHAGPSLIRLRGLRTMFVVMLGLGGLFGSTEVVTVAFVDHAGHRPLTGLVLGTWALGSALAGLVYGATRFRTALHRRFLIGVTAMWLATFLLLVPDDVYPLMGLLFVGGFTIAPTLVSGMGLVEALAPKARLTEAMTWATTGITLGATAGVAIGGWAVDEYGSQSAFLTTVFSGTIAALAAYAGARKLAPRPPEEKPVVHADLEELGT
ncbi:MFS transporter [Carbonactinospora thermoautotrophica]|uniref:MFS transporter n=1 Tax=Carbonactinospora thermoautotrophica TaxID=1469144 RepID=UPI00226E9D9E|nr:MFS transporter [Carbonactinospora thermoautotrophica]MCX9191194.1 MFS transporter [Carbonactinospora thermoautotrophica]